MPLSIAATWFSETVVTVPAVCALGFVLVAAIGRTRGDRRARDPLRVFSADSRRRRRA
jgi:hypothetical protein